MPWDRIDDIIELLNEEDHYDPGLGRWTEKMEPWTEKWGFEPDALRYDDPDADLEAWWDSCPEPIDDAACDAFDAWLRFCEK